MFIRKLYYDLSTGDAIECHMRKGDVVQTTIEQDLASYPALMGRTTKNTGCIEWLEEDRELEHLFRTATNKRVDGGRVAFDFTPITPISKPLSKDDVIADLRAQLAARDTEIEELNTIIKKEGRDRTDNIIK